jgi:hypothetical protein
MPVPPVTTLPRLFGQVKMSSLLTLNGFDRAISGCVVGLPVQGHPDRKTHRCVILNNLNATDGLAPATV